jgi:ADP-heptose:LPS heptosyltransferase
MHIIISRTDNIGDVVLTLPVCIAIRTAFPQCNISFLGKDYTRAVVEACPAINEFISYNQLCRMKTTESADYLKSLMADVIVFIYPEATAMKWAAAARIKMRIATSGRWHSWLYCNYRIKMSRKRSNLHEAQLNFKLLFPLGINEVPTLGELAKASFMPAPTPNDNVFQILNSIPQGKRIILHALGVSGIDWPLESFLRLGKMLAEKEFHVIFTGTESDGIVLRKQLPTSEQFHDVTGKFSLDELIQFIGQCQGFVACSTGPMHIAAALGIPTVGLFSPHRPIHPGRWAPLGPHAHYLCASQFHDNHLDVPVENVFQAILNALP